MVELIESRILDTLFTNGTLRGETDSTYRVGHSTYGCQLCHFINVCDFETNIHLIIDLSTRNMLQSNLDFYIL